MVESNDLEGDNGQLWLKKHLIIIDKNLPKTRQESVLLREITECVNAYFELELEHRAIETLEEVLYQVLKDNDLKF